jgi:hypothetical protein
VLQDGQGKMSQSQFIDSSGPRWAGKFENAGQLKAEVVAFLEQKGWVIEGEDDMRGLDFANLLS